MLVLENIFKYKEDTMMVTGHRPLSLPGEYDWMHPKNIKLMTYIRWIFKHMIDTGKINKIITGGALGIDQMSYAVANKLKKEGRDIQLYIAVPFENQAMKWSDRLRKLYYSQLESADGVIYVDKLGTMKNPNLSKYKCDKVDIGLYHNDKIQLRNEFMVDISSYGLAVMKSNMSFDGTYNCKKYMLDQWKSNQIIRLNPENFSNNFYKVLKYRPGS